MQVSYNEWSLGKLSTERYAMAFILEKDNCVTEILICGKIFHSYDANTKT